MATLTVGTNQQFARISDAVNASRDGDVLNVQAGTYVNDFAIINKSITMQGVGGMVHMVATTRPPNGKAILTTNGNVTIDHFEFSGARVADRNGAGIRYESGNLTITNSYFHHNENGILGGGNGTGSISIRNSEFAYNGYGDGQSHNLYVGRVAQLTVQDSYFHDAVIGHEIKSRALNTSITGSRIMNNNGTGSYEIDLPNGGQGLIAGNVIQQSANGDNPYIVAFGEEGSLHGSNSLVVRDNTIVNDRSIGTAVYNATSVTATMDANRVFGLGLPAATRGPVAQTGSVGLSSRPTLSTASPIGGNVVPPVVIPPVVVPPVVVPPVVVPPVVVPPVVVPPTPAASPPVVVGSGPDSLVLLMSEDAYQGDAQFTVRVDGTQVGGIQTTTALKSAGASQSFTFRGTFGSGQHSVEVSFLNDAWGGTMATDRNLYVDRATFNGTIVEGAAGRLMSTSTRSIVVPAAAPVVPPVVVPPVVVPPVIVPPVVVPPAPTNAPPVVVGSGPDRLELRVSEDAYLGDAQFTVRIDGAQVGGVQTATALKASDATQSFTFQGNFGPGPHSVQVSFLNDAWGGTTATDRNLYVDSASFNGTAVAGAAGGLMAASTRTIAVPATGSVPATPQTGPTPTTVVFNLSEDAWQGHAQALVSVDGRQLGGVETITASHALGQTQKLSFIVPLAAGAHQATVQFLNDAWGGTTMTDRNLYVASIEIGGQRIDPAAAILSNGTLTFTVPAPVNLLPVV